MFIEGIALLVVSNILRSVDKISKKKIGIPMLPQVWHNDATVMGEKWTSRERLAHQFYEKAPIISTKSGNH